MPQITIHDVGIDEALRRLDSLGNPTQAGQVRRRMLGAGIRVIERRTKQILSGQRSGHVYRLRGREHQASAPGEPPATDLGTLKNSLRVHSVTSERAEFGPTAEYGGYLEFGTRRMAARPYLRPAVESSANDVQSAMVAVADEALNGR